MTNPIASPLENLRVLNLCRDRGLYAGKVLADLGADVLKIEEPRGDEARRRGPFKDDIPGQDVSLYFLYYCTNQRGITLNLESRSGQDIFKQLVKRTDVLVEDFQPDARKSLGIDYPGLCAINPRIIVTSITAFGQDGPYSEYKSPDIVSFAMGGLMFLSGDPGKAPVLAPGEQAYHNASVFACFGTLVALHSRLTTGAGQAVEVSAQEALAIQEHLIVRYSLEADIVRRRGSQHTTAPSRIFPCKDGFVYLFIFSVRHWRSLLKMMGNPDALQGEAWEDVRFRRLNVDVIDPLVTEFCLRHTKTELAARCQTDHIPCTPVNSPAEFVNDPHIRARDFIIAAEHPVVGKHQYLGPPYKLGESPCRIRRAAPLLAQDNEEIYGHELGYSKYDLTRFKAEGVI